MERVCAPCPNPKSSKIRFELVSSARNSQITSNSTENYAQSQVWQGLSQAWAHTVEIDRLSKNKMILRWLNVNRSSIIVRVYHEVTAFSLNYIAKQTVH